MTSKILLLLVSLAVICLALPQKNLVEACNRPKAFKNTDVLAEYINCLKSLGDQRYGKRSQPNQLMRILHPKNYLDYEQHLNRELQELYNILKNYEKLNVE
ncbi:hypothetical protein NQ315_009355 [Exocentrus adspersus]|uniref:Uncharacterized protein n=1 Tax=Exocentrus adspersus TaxID=1586481 RepID=A0AAV8WGE1_9CUCU|nr:hypothetical protein NQ315_009355 [Exocentrus adspersus]